MRLGSSGGFVQHMLTLNLKSLVFVKRERRVRIRMCGYHIPDIVSRHKHARTALEGPLELSMETDSIVGQVGWFLVFGFTIGSFEGDAECLVQIPEQIAVERAVVGPTEQGIG